MTAGLATLIPPAPGRGDRQIFDDQHQWTTGVAARATPGHRRRRRQGSFPAARIWYRTLLGPFPNARFSDCAYLCAEQDRIPARDGEVGRNAAQTLRAAFPEVGIG